MLERSSTPKSAERLVLLRGAWPHFNLRRRRSGRNAKAAGVGADPRTYSELAPSPDARQSMKQNLVSPGVYRLTHGISNFYIVDRGGRLLLVDAGVPRDWTRFVQAVNSLGRALSDVDAIVLTHAHSDHTGGARAGLRRG
jgi:glyoxylase-like metal-dependent hydrolase (beta-lactamase superfamily II)